MNETGSVSVTLDLDLTIPQIAAAFTGLTDDGQAQFFVEVAKIAATWPSGPCPIDQWYAVGRHLRMCECSTEEACAIVQRIAEGVGVGIPSD